MKVNGKEFAFKRAEIKLRNPAEKFYDENIVPLKDVFISGQPGTPEWEKLRVVWKQFCEMIFEKWDEQLSFENLTTEEVLEIRLGFFGYTQTNIPTSKGS